MKMSKTLILSWHLKGNLNKVDDKYHKKLFKLLNGYNFVVLTNVCEEKYIRPIFDKFEGKKYFVSTGINAGIVLWDDSLCDLVGSHQDAEFSYCTLEGNSGSLIIHFIPIDFSKIDKQRRKKLFENLLVLLENLSKNINNVDPKICIAGNFQFNIAPNESYTSKIFLKKYLKSLDIPVDNLIAKRLKCVNDFYKHSSSADENIVQDGVLIFE